MKNFLLLALVFVSSFSLYSKSYTHIYDQKVSSKPLIVKFDPNNLNVHVICEGNDKNFNGKFDEGDEYPSWWIIPKPGVNLPNKEILDSTKKILDFDMNAFKFPLRTFFKFDFGLNEGYLMVSLNDTLKAFSLKDARLIYENCGIYKATSFFVENNLIYAVTENQEINIVDILNAFSLKTIKLNFLPNGILKFSNDKLNYLAVLCEGDFGKSNSQISFFKENDSTWEFVKKLDIGASGNYFIKDSNYIYIAMNGSHEVKVIDIPTLEIYTSIQLGTNFYDGPREIIDSEEFLYVTTYAGDIRKINKSKMELSSIYEAQNKLESLDFIEETYMVAAGPFKKDSYEADSTVAFFTSLLDVYEDNSQSILQTLEIGNSILFNTYENISEFEIYDGLAQRVFYLPNIQNSQIEIPKELFVNGIYFAKAKINKNLTIVKFAVIK